MDMPRVSHRYVDVDGVRVFYREAGPRDAPTLLLLHGFPTASHQFRRLIDALGTRYHLLAPDYPGFGHTEAPDGFRYDFEALAGVLEGFVRAVGVSRFALYAFDFGGPVGFRLAVRHPEWITGLIVQNANAYEEGLSALARAAIAHRTGEPGAAEAVQELFTLPVTRGQYEQGAADAAQLDPDAWTLDQHHLDRPGRNAAQTALALDYHSNVEQYPRWQQWLREHRPPTLVLWGRNDGFFTEEGARAYLRDVPGAELHVFDAGHFALAERLPEIAPIVERFLDRLPAPAERRALRIAVLGASGHLGGAVATEAVARGHLVTPLGRADADATDPAALAAVLGGHDAVVASPKGGDHLVPRAAAALLEALPKAGVERLLFVGGGGSLEYAPGRRFVDSPDFPPQYLETARDQAQALDVLRAATGTPVVWSYASPPPMHLVPGERTGRYRAEARDTPLADAGDVSRITVGDYASAVVDAIERGSFVRRRFTAAY
ncbi:alpha/beta fold hydrolase [Kitasatospora sp. NPDC059571]|uniref:alpha/beta fold hydrolase n=1 Tax=Kitasatospora sp. NPDC059571 TaxID=3346871 RepID=UPI00369BE870